MSARSSKTSQESHGSVDTLKPSGSTSTVKDVTSSKQRRSVSADIVDIQPLVYSFRVPRNPSPGSVMTATLPPYWLYHDHAFGVIWILFHTDKKYIGISPLHWCLRFLLDLKNSEGEYTGDVNISIQAVQDDLIEQYANLGTVLENQAVTMKGEIKDRSKETDGGNDRDGKDKRPKYNEKKSVKNSSRTGSKSSFRGNDQAKYKGTVRGSSIEVVRSEGKGSHADSIEDTICSDEAQRDNKVGYKSNRPSMALITPSASIVSETTGLKKTRSTSSKVRCASPSSSMSFCELPSTSALHSITYNEMISRGPMPYTEQTPIEQIFKADLTPEFATSTPKKAVKSKQTANERRISLTDMCTDELVHFLNGTRQQHVERIKKEVERLYDLEKFMEIVNKRGFSAYITGDLARRLANLDGRDIVKEIENIMK